VSVSFLLTGRFSDILGRRWFFIVGNAIGLVGSIIGGTAQSINQLIAGNALLGAAAAVQLSFTIVISELLPAKWRGYGIGALFFSSMPFAAFGPVIARAFVLNTGAGWRWSYYLNIIVAGITVILLVIFFRKYRSSALQHVQEQQLMYRVRELDPPTSKMLHTRHTTKEILRMLDLGGAVLFVGGLVLFLIGISWGGVIYPWKSGHVIGMILGGVATLAIFVLYGRPQPVDLLCHVN
jgi:MFS family permease